MDDSVYNLLEDNSTEVEKLSIAISFIYANSGYALDYGKLNIQTSKAIVFNKKLLETGFVTNFDRGLEDRPFLHITDEGRVMIAEYGTYLDYYNQNIEPKSLGTLSPTGDTKVISSSELTPIQKLDDLLKFFATHEHRKKYLTYNQIKQFVALSESLLPEDEIESVLGKLVLDGNVKTEMLTFMPMLGGEPEECYKISFNGEVLYAQGGYQELQNQRNAENIRLERTESHGKPTIFDLVNSNCRLRRFD